MSKCVFWLNTIPSGGVGSVCDAYGLLLNELDQYGDKPPGHILIVGSSMGSNGQLCEIIEKLSPDLVLSLRIGKSNCNDALLVSLFCVDNVDGAYFCDLNALNVVRMDSSLAEFKLPFKIYAQVAGLDKHIKDKGVLNFNNIVENILCVRPIYKPGILNEFIVSYLRAIAKCSAAEWKLFESGEIYGGYEENTYLFEDIKWISHDGLIKQYKAAIESISGLSDILKEKIKQRIAWVEYGGFLKDALIGEIRRNEFPKYFLWFSRYLLTASRVFLKSGLTNVSYLLAYKALEVYVKALLIALGRGSYNKNRFLCSEVSRQGLGQYWKVVRTEYSQVVSEATEKEVLKYFDLRNRCLLAHGFISIGPIECERFYDTIIGVISKIEKRVDVDGKLWEKVKYGSFESAVVKILSSLKEDFTKKYDWLVEVK